MTQPDPTIPQILEDLKVSFVHTSGIPSKSQAEEGVTYHTEAGKQRLFKHIDEASHKLTRVVEKRVIDELEKLHVNKHGYITFEDVLERIAQLSHQYSKESSAPNSK